MENFIKFRDSNEVIEKYNGKSLEWKNCEFCIRKCSFLMQVVCKIATNEVCIELLGSNEA